VANKPKKNRSARDKRQDRQRAQRQARKLQSMTPLYHLQPPFKGYEEWYRVPDAANDTLVHPVRYDDRVSDGAKDLADTLVRLSPRYRGMVPLAAVFLDQQIQKGIVCIAITGKPERFREVPLAEMAADVSSPEFLEEMRKHMPEEEMPDGPLGMSDEGAAMAVHELHAQGYLVLDDDYVVNLAMPPKAPGGKWHLNGHDGGMP